MIDLNLEIKGFGKINEANIKLNKINVVGGINSSGKSTVARLLYCYLKANVLNNEEYVRKVILDKLDMIDGGISLSPDITLSDIIQEYENNFPQNDDIDSIIDLLSQDKQISYTSILRDLLVKENLDYFKGYSKFFNSDFTSILGNDFNKNKFDDGFVEVRSKLREKVFINEDDEYFNDDEIFHSDYDDMYEMDIPSGNYYYGDDPAKDIEDDISIGCYKLYVYKTKGSLNLSDDVFYIDSISILDMLEFINSEKTDANNIDVIYPKNHIKYLIDSLSDINVFPYNRNLGISAFDFLEEDYLEEECGLSKQTVDILKKIFNIINGEVSSGKSDVYYSIDDLVIQSVGTGNIASGIKQIGILQLLLSNGKLKENSFLIIDEPEVNLHPYWQFKFAEILVMLAKDADITIYINSHSPMFIEAMDALTEFYDMKNDINYYLTEKLKNEEKFNFIKINQDKLYMIYDTLGMPYDLIDQLRLKKHLGD